MEKQPDTPDIQTLHKTRSISLDEYWSVLYTNYKGYPHIFLKEGEILFEKSSFIFADLFSVFFGLFPQ